METLFEDYIQKGRIFEALIVGQNLMRKSLDLRITGKYIDFLLKLSDKTELLNQKLAYINQADSTLDYYSLYADLSNEAMEFVKEYKEKIEGSRSFVSERIQTEENEARKKKIIYNNEAFDLIKKLYGKLRSNSDEDAINRILDNIRRVDESIEREYMTPEQVSEYEGLTRKLSDEVAKKLKELDDKKNAEYNLRAVDAYEKAFNMFKNADVTADVEKIVAEFFSFDSSRLSPETSMYYNHVYSFIFGKLNDEEKFAFTKKAIAYQMRGKR